MLTGTVTAPIRAAPTIISNSRTEFGNATRTRSPGSTPAAANADAYRPARSSSSPKVTEVGPCRNGDPVPAAGRAEVGLCRQAVGAQRRGPRSVGSDWMARSIALPP